METKGFFQFVIIINVLASYFRFIWIPILRVYHQQKFFPCGDRPYTSESDVYRRQILTYKNGPRAGRVQLKGFYVELRSEYLGYTDINLTICRSRSWYGIWKPIRKSGQLFWQFYVVHTMRWHYRPRKKCGGGWCTTSIFTISWQIYPNLNPLGTTIAVFSLLYYSVKTPLLETKCLFN